MAAARQRSRSTQPQRSRSGKSGLSVVGATVKKAPVSTPPPRHSVDVDQTISGMRDDHLQCRDFGHSWRPYTARWSPEDRCYETQLRCQRCKTIRVRLIGQRGEQLSNHYDYADGYIVKGMGRLDGDERNRLRLESVQRIMPNDTAEDD